MKIKLRFMKINLRFMNIKLRFPASAGMTKYRNIRLYTRRWALRSGVVHTYPANGMTHISIAGI
jgi:hypothetical protein